MAYCRWSDGDCYVYSDVNDRMGEIRCCSCTLPFVASLRGGVFEQPYPSFIAKGPKEMIDHLNEHVAVGHSVPRYAFTRLREKARELAKKPIRYPIHFHVAKMERNDGSVVDSIVGPLPVCGYNNNAHFRKLLGIKKSENGYAHHRDECTFDKKQVTCRQCKTLIKAEKNYMPFKGKKTPPSTTSKTK